MSCLGMDLVRSHFLEFRSRLRVEMKYEVYIFFIKKFIKSYLAQVFDCFHFWQPGFLKPGLHYFNFWHSNFLRMPVLL